MSISTRGAVAVGGDDPPGRFEPVHPGIRMSISTTSGRHRRAASTASMPSLGLGDDAEVRLGFEDHPKAGADECLVVGDQDR